MREPCRRPAVLLVLMALLVTSCRTSSAERPDAPAARPRPGPTATALPAAPLGVKWEWDRLSAYRSFLEELPGGGTFFELVWCDVERTRGQRDWATVDGVVDGARSLGFDMALKIRVGSCWATSERLDGRGLRDKTASLMPVDLDAYREFVTAAVSRYHPQGVRRWAIENEVNGEGFWAGTPEDYAALARIAATTIREADPAATIFDSGLSSTVYGAAVARWLLDRGQGDEAVDAYQRYYDRRFAVRAGQLSPAADPDGLRVALRREQPERNLAFLAVTLQLAAEGTVDAWQLHFYERWDNVPVLLDFLRAHLPAGMPVESWETGLFWPDAPADEAVLAGETVKVVALLLAGGVTGVWWLPATSNPQGRSADERRAALFDPDGRPRLSAEDFARMAAAAAGAEARPLDTGGFQGVALERDGRTVIVAWAEDSSTSPGSEPAFVELPLPADQALSAWSDRRGTQR